MSNVNLEQFSPLIRMDFELKKFIKDTYWNQER
jgi:hypothetical protein